MLIYMESLRVFWENWELLGMGNTSVCVDTHLHLSRYSSMCDRVSQSKADR